jgi:murein DD-endopeptidase MepM/ murein hydrolase activator NlpD
MGWRRLQNCDKSRLKSLIFSIFCVFLVFFVFSQILPIKCVQSAEDNDSILEINKKLQEKKERANELQKQIEEYHNKVRETQRRATTLKNQIGILDSGIAETELDIEAKLLEIEELELEQDLVTEKISQENQNIDDKKNTIGEILKSLNRFERKSYLAILVSQTSFSQLFDEMHRNEILNNDLFTQLQALKQVKLSLENNQQLLEQKKQDTVTVKNQLDESKITLEEQKNLKERLFGVTKASEEEFQKLLLQLRSEEAAIDSEIVTLEKSVRQKLQALDGLGEVGGKLTWPLNPSRGITASFHDQDYPFRYIFEHTGIDIRAGQGTTVQAAAGGYVAKVYNGGMGDKPSYVMIVHAEGLSTVYMHLASINVVEDTYVTRGQIIGASGGTPGTSGAGRWTTGPHLHFEVRLNGIPVDPLGYLP